MNNTSNEQDRAEKRLRKIGGGLIIIAVLSACAYFFPRHPAVVSFTILGSLLAILKAGRAKQIFDLLNSFSEWAISISYQALVKILRCVRRILQALRLLPKTTTEKEE